VPHEWSEDTEQAAWWVDALHPFAQDVGSVVPDVFPAFARVLHPVHEGGRRRSWADVAREHGRIAHAEMQLHEISRPLGAPRVVEYQMDGRVEWGSLPLPELEVLGEIVERHTRTASRCWFAVWEGYAQLTLLPVPSRRIEVPQRSYYLLEGALADLPEIARTLDDQSPNVWWPDDRAWCVATEVDFAWTYVGGSAALVDALVDDTRLEVVRARPSDLMSWGGDLVNAALDEA
jgi:hypothetical protein